MSKTASLCLGLSPGQHDREGESRQSGSEEAGDLADPTIQYSTIHNNTQYSTIQTIHILNTQYAILNTQNPICNTQYRIHYLSRKGTGEEKSRTSPIMRR